MSVHAYCVLVAHGCDEGESIFASKKKVEMEFIRHEINDASGGDSIIDQNNI